jgi:hypothetical protein
MPAKYNTDLNLNETADLQRDPALYRPNEELP